MLSQKGFEVEEDMSRKKVKLVVGSNPTYDLGAFKYFILNLNKIQNYYEFSFLDLENQEFLFTEEIYSEKDYFTKIGEKFPNFNEYFILVIVTSTIEGNLFWVVQNNIGIVTTDMWDRYFSPPSLFEYLNHSIIGCLLAMEGLSSHNDTNGCVLDYTRDKYEDKIDIALGYICDSHKEIIIREKDAEYYRDILKIIERNWIGERNHIGDVAYNLQHIFRFNINKDSGFNKTKIEKMVEYLSEIPKEALITAISILIGIVIGKLII